MNSQQSDEKQLEQLARDLLATSPSLRQSALKSIQLLAGDMSTRRYVRLSLEGKVNSAILMLLNQATGPIKGGRQDLTQDDTFVMISQYLESISVRVPKVYVDARKAKALIVEDIGDLGLWRFPLQQFRNEDQAVYEVVEKQGEPTEVLFKRAIDVIVQIQRSYTTSTSVAHQRWAEFDWYRQTIREFTEFYAVPKGLKPSALQVLYKSFDAICECIAAQPKTLAHFDYMAFNLFVLPDGQLCVLDFQDMSVNSPVRDLISLLNDRDIDMALGKSRHQRLLNYFVEQAQLGPQFVNWYNEYLLHWDFRVSGRFLQLADKRGIERYRQWVPGTLRRLGRTLVRAHTQLHGLDDVLDMLTNLSPEIAEGAGDPWPLDV
jgi:aminoglycoside/choline kinase family phosphotransferase